MRGCVFEIHPLHYFGNWLFMKRWRRRVAYILVIAMWLAVMSFPFLAFYLSTRGEIRLGGEQHSIRVFLLQEDEAQGIGIARERPLPDQPACNHTRVTYLLWQGQGQNTTYCQCPDTGVISCPP